MMKFALLVHFCKVVCNVLAPLVGLSKAIQMIILDIKSKVMLHFILC